MELKFIWIEEYKNIKKTGFNFNHSFDVEFHYIDTEIIISPKINNLPKSFFKDNISSVTAIVGKNGSGKTNLTEFINYNLAHVTNGSLSRYQAGSKGILIIDNFIFSQENIIIKNNKKLEELGYEILDYEKVPLDKQGGRKWAEMSKNKYIYYSPAFEFRYINMESNLTNISTSYLAFNDVNKTTKHYNLNSATHSSSSEIKTDSLTAHYLNEMIRESDFILNFNSSEYIGESPVDLTISIDMVEENRLLQRDHFNKTENEEGILLNKLWEEINELERRIWNYGFTELNNYKLQETDKTDAYDYYQIPVKNQKDIFRRLFLINLFKILIRTGSVFKVGFFSDFIYSPETINNTDLGDILKSINSKLLGFIDECVWKEEKTKSRKESSFALHSKLQFELIRNAKLNISNPEKKKNFLELIKSCKEITKNRLFFHYQFANNYSSGQQNLLNFYSRFYWAKNQISDSEKDDIYDFFSDQIILFIDEGEVALHPEWQRQFFNKVTTFLSEIFIDRKIQLILTTHSPFVLSDIPKDNVLLLEKDINGNTKISNIVRENTFGANIHELLADSFFLNDGFIGDFAKEKIALTLNWLKMKAHESKKTANSDFTIDKNIQTLKFESNEAEFEYHRNIINLIGEPLVKNKLMSMFIEYVNDDAAFLKSELEKAQLKVQELQKRIGNA